MEQGNTSVQPVMKSEPAKKNTAAYVLGSLLAVATIAATVFAVLYFMNLGTEKEVADTNEPAETVEVVEKPDGTTEEVVTTTSSSAYGFSLDKVVNDKDLQIDMGGDVWTLTQEIETPGAFGVGISVASDRRTLNLNLNGETLKQVYGDGLTRTYDYEEKTVTFNKEIRDGMFARFGQATGDEYIFVIMGDGSVEYIPFLKMLNEGKFESYGKLDVKNAVKFYVGSLNGLRNFVQVDNGDIYDLGKLVNLY